MNVHTCEGFEQLIAEPGERSMERYEPHESQQNMAMCTGRAFVANGAWHDWNRAERLRCSEKTNRYAQTQELSEWRKG